MITPKFRILSKINVFDKNFDVWRKFWFLTKILIFSRNFRFLTKILIFSGKFRFLTKFLFLGNLAFWRNFWFFCLKFRCLTKNWIFEKKIFGNFDFWRKFLFFWQFWFLTKISIFVEQIIFGFTRISMSKKIIWDRTLSCADVYILFSTEVCRLQLRRPILGLDFGQMCPGG